MTKKYELTNETKTAWNGETLYRIKALRDIARHAVEKGDLGGWIASEKKLAQDGDAWVSGNAEVYGNADYTTIHGFGTQFRTTTFFQCEDKQIRVSCGCFLGTIPEFREQVKNTREGKIAEEYLMIADLMEKHFVKEK